MDTLVEVGKWVLLVLAAGFVGQFGKSLAQAILEKRRARKARRATPPPQEAQPSPYPQAEDPKAWKKRAKLEKKRLKAEAKRAKKAPSHEGKGVSE